ncbi:hypothetical protein BGZ57DRAFT_571867 [Hyaloscypha finlandica]|nr:hypothetical protein BGZ57DRAFT_571867 [Hyaloscypha finlandica]
MGMEYWSPMDVIQTPLQRILAFTILCILLVTMALPLNAAPNGQLLWTLTWVKRIQHMSINRRILLLGLCHSLRPVPRTHWVAFTYRLEFLCLKSLQVPSLRSMNQHSTLISTSWLTMRPSAVQKVSQLLQPGPVVVMSKCRQSRRRQPSMPRTKAG